jgi:hypothetical protein
MAWSRSVSSVTYLTKHAGLVDHGRARRHALGQALVDDDLARVGIGGVVEHLGGRGGRGQAGAQLQQLAQLVVLEAQLLDLMRPLRLRRQLDAGLRLIGLRTCQRLQVAAGVARGQHRAQRQPLHRVQHHRRCGAQGLRDAEAGVGHHQE